jgi:hypothetical protein
VVAEAQIQFKQQLPEDQALVGQEEHLRSAQQMHQLQIPAAAAVVQVRLVQLLCLGMEVLAL